MAETEPQAQVEQHEAFHLPPPSIWPAVLAVGIALLLMSKYLAAGVVLAMFPGPARP